MILVVILSVKSIDDQTGIHKIVVEMYFIIHSIDKIEFMSLCSRNLAIVRASS